MSRRYTSYYPLALALLFGLVVSLIPVSPALGDNVTVIGCQGSTTSSAKVILGGRVITPSTILRTVNGQPCAQDEIPITLSSNSSSPIFTRTIIVSPLGTPTQNGAALLAARDIISNANPSISNPWLLKLEPGNYDLNGQSFKMLGYVDLEGSGEGTTVISSTIGNTVFPTTTATLIAASNSEIRFLKVANSGSTGYQVAIFVPNMGITNTRFTHITAAASNTANLESQSIINFFGNITIQDSTITASGGDYSYGVINDMGNVIVRNTTIIAAGNLDSRGYDDGGNTTIINSKIMAIGGINNSYGYLGSNSTHSQVVSSQLAGEMAPSYLLTVCPYSYDGNFVPLTNGVCH